MIKTLSPWLLSFLLVACSSSTSVRHEESEAAAPKPGRASQKSVPASATLAEEYLSLSIEQEQGLVIIPEPGLVPEENRENYAGQDTTPLKTVSQDPVSTFSVDVDTAGYSNVRRFLSLGR